MRDYLPAALAVLTVAGLAIPATADPPTGQPIDLLAGDSLDAWDHFLIDADVRKEDVWSVNDGVLVCRGKPLGYLYTKDKYQDFQLTFQWRWAPGTDPGNSGVLLRIAGEPVSFLPKCVEAQLMNGSAGDIWAFYGAAVSGDQDRMRTVENHEQLGTFHGVGKIKFAEKDPGQWNKYEITAKGDTLNLMINGELVNTVTGCDQVEGSIGLQSEGGEIHFRDIRVTPLE